MIMTWNTSFGVGGVFFFSSGFFFSLTPSGGSVIPAPCKWCLVHALCAGRCPGSVGCLGWPIGSAGSPGGPWLQGRSGAGSGSCRASGLEVCLGACPSSCLSKEYLDRNYAHAKPGNSSEVPNNWAEWSGCSLKCFLVVKWLLYHQW